MTIEETVEALPGLDSNSKGKLYSNYPFPPLDHLPSLLTNTQARVGWLLNKLDLVDKDVIDMGCANGGITIQLALTGIPRSIIGIDKDEAYIEVAKSAASIVRADVDFYCAPGFTPGTYTILSFSVWKWIYHLEGEAAAYTALDTWSECGELVFESGLTGTGIDLIPVKMEDIRGILEARFKSVELLGLFPRDPAHNVNREVWLCRSTT